MPIICAQCGVEKPDSELNRQRKRGREHFFCTESKVSIPGGILDEWLDKNPLPQAA